ncbi:DUF7670 domain-containing protein [Robiginitalea sp.]|uniref:DUF7670 domain-containing protein n=1 Tax=Robiginitalea sp. TaxID=1902411 RepID=UPI003C788CCD
MRKIKIFRWAVRGLSGLLILFSLFMFIGETFFPPESLNPEPLSANSIVQLSLFGIVLLGLGLAWKWELTGGLIALSAFIVLVTVNPNALQFSLLLLYPGTAILFMLLWVISSALEENN